MTELERLLAESLKRLDEQHSASVAQLSESVAELNGRVDALLIGYQELVGEYEQLATAYRRLEADMNSIVRAIERTVNRLRQIARHGRDRGGFDWSR